MGREPDNRGFVLLGIKYEAARLGGVDGDTLARIEEQIRAEAGDLWSTNEQLIRGRNAVRAEHGLAPLGEPPQRNTRDSGPSRQPLWRRLFGG